MVSWTITVGSLWVALISAWEIQRRRGVYWLGRQGPLLGPAVLFSLWLAGLSAGELLGSQPAMAVTGALPLVGLAVYSRRQHGVRHRRHRLWTPWDLAAWAFIAAVVLLIPLHDIECHRAVVGAYLRGNIPPTAMNNPAFPLTYHSLYDAVVALVARTLPIDVELALDLVSLACVGLTLLNLGAVSHGLSWSPTAAQVGRLFFVLGLGPTFFRAIYFHNVFGLHGSTTQAFTAVILRRPVALGFVLFTLALALLLPHHAERAGGVPLRRGPHPALLLPLLLVVPQVSEELMLILLVLLVLVILRKRIPWVWSLAGVVVLLMGLLRSGVFLGLLGRASMPVPGLRFEWPPTWPSWDFHDAGMPVISLASATFLGGELGPVFLVTAALVLVRGTPRQRTMVIPFILGLLTVSFIDPSPWPKADLDRFLFYGTPPIFMLTALWLDKLLAWAPREGLTRVAMRSGAVLLVPFTIAGPMVHMVRMAHGAPRRPWVTPRAEDAAKRSARGRRQRGGHHICGPRQRACSNRLHCGGTHDQPFCRLRGPGRV